MNDKFYTKSEIAKVCIDFLKEKINTEKYIFIEPSAGNGSFLNHLPEDSIGIDIDPKTEKCYFYNFFNFNLYYDKLIIIGCPPFGINNYLAEEFIKHSISLTNIIAFILPCNFKLNKELSKKLVLLESMPLPNNSFILEDKDFNIDCSFFIFTKKIKKEKNYNCKYFTFCNKFDLANCSIDRENIKAIPYNDSMYDKKKQYFSLFINIDLMNVEEFCYIFNNIKFKPKQKKLSKKELVEGFFKELDKNKNKEYN